MDEGGSILEAARLLTTPNLNGPRLSFQDKGIDPEFKVFDRNPGNCEEECEEEDEGREETKAAAEAMAAVFGVSIDLRNAILNIYSSAF